MFLAIAIFLIFLSANVDGKDPYCKPRLCQRGATHIACNNKASELTSCPYEHEVISVGEDLKQLILNEHNLIRTIVASGGLKNYKPALRMATMRWNQDLADLAQLNGNQCRMEFDACHNTRRFRKSGQNIFLASTENPIDEKKFAHLALKTWFLEQTLANSTVIRRNDNKEKALQTHSFANIVLDRNTHLGCAIVKYRREMNYFLMVCNYSDKAKQNKAIYASSGLPGAGCLSGTNSKRPSLCSVKERY